MSVAGIESISPLNIDPQSEQRPNNEIYTTPYKLIFAFLNFNEHGSFVCKKKWSCTTLLHSNGDNILYIFVPCCSLYAFCLGLIEFHSFKEKVISNVNFSL